MPLSTRHLGATGLNVTEIGFGSYRIDVEVEAHRQALTAALRQGINLIDTSSNYGNGRSEMLIGQVLRRLIAAGELDRREVVVVSKAGYLQGFNYVLSQQRQEEGRPFPDLVPYADGLAHCIHPDFLSDQLTRSLDRLQLNTLDVYLLHNPEYFLSWSQQNGTPLAEARAEYERRIALAFAHLEQEVQNGRIRWYGISSNTFPYPADSPEFTSLSRIWTLAQHLTPDHHFRVIQMPMNLLETGAATCANQPDGRSVLDFATDMGLGILINRPLNAIRGQNMIRLADVLPPSYPASAREVSTAVDTLVAAELRLQQELLPPVPFEAETKRGLLEMLAVGRILDGQWRSFGTYHNWRDVQSQYLLPRAQMALDFLSNWQNSPPELTLWREGYVEAVNVLFGAVGAFYRQLSHEEAQRLQATAVSVNPAWEAETLSLTAVRALRRVRGVSSVLVGMRQQPYVAEMVRELETAVTPSDTSETWQQLANAWTL